MNMFEEALRKSYRFPSDKGGLTTEQLWQLPLKRGVPNLNDVAISLHKLLEDRAVSFVDDVDQGVTVSGFSTADMQKKLEIVKHIIAEKKREISLKTEEAEKAEVRSKLKQALADKESEAYKSMSKEEIKAALGAL